MENNFTEGAALFLNCKCGELPFKYLGLPIGANLKSMAMWEPVKTTMPNRLSTWKIIHLSLGGE